MGERAKIILNEYSAKSLLMRDTLDLDKFYTADLKLFVEVARKEIKRLNNIIKAKDEGIKALTEDLCEESIKIEKAIEYIEKRKQEREKANKYAYDIRNDDFIKYCNIELDILKGDDKE